MNKISKNAALMILTSAFVWLCFSQTARAATFTVNLAGDAGDLTCDVSCTLRDAIDDANNLAGNDTINFTAGLTNITLTGEIIITNNGSLAINGLGANILTIDGGAGTNRIFFNNTGATITITDVTLTGGNGTGASNSGFGGAIFVSGGSLTLTRVHINGNTAAAQGGGLYSGGVATRQITDSTISNNSVGAGANFGGGMMIVSASSVNITNTTVSGNTAPSNGGGIYFDSSNATLRSVTVTNNSVTAGGSGGGIFKTGGGVLNLGNTIVAGNFAPSTSPPEIGNNGTTTSSGFNLIGDSAGDAANTGTAITYQSTDILDTNPRLSGLANNGGPTPTHALQPFPAVSPAIDKGSGFGLTTDQRGMPRPFDVPSIPNATGGDASDIGAFENQGPTIATVSVSGRVTGGKGGAAISKAIVYLTDSSGNTRTALTNPFGFYRFDEVSAGEVYIFEVGSKIYQFADNPRVLLISEDVNDLNFDALP